MKALIKSLNHKIKPTILVTLFFSGSSLFAVTAPKQNKPAKQSPSNTRANITYIKDFSVFTSHLPTRISAVQRTLAIPDADVMKRLNDSTKDTLIEPLQLTVPMEDDKILAVAARVAKPGRKLSLAHYLQQNLEQSEGIPGTNLKLVNLNAQSLEMIERSEFDQLYAKDHFQLTLQTDNFAKNPDQRERFIAQISPYLTQAQIANVRRKIQGSKPLDLDTELLPIFAKNSVKHHTIYKGPNCFHAALSFQNPELAKRSTVNVREEPGYHRSMINYDELWRVTQLEFYEVDPTKADIQYGDMILFFDAPKSPKVAVDFHTLRHAATYLFGGYVFAKGSKSANSPYLVKPLSDEWSTWSKYTENLGVKVYRRNLKHVNNAALWDPNDWMY